MKLVFFTDPHITSRKPAGRSDDYFLTMENKLLEIIDMAEDADYIINAGDIFDRYNPAISAMNMLIDFVEKLPCPMIICPGNHDMQGYNYNRLDSTGLGFCCRFLDKIVLLDPDNPYYQLDTNVHIHFKPTSINNPMQEFMAPVKPGINMGIIHDMLIDKTLFEDCTLISNFKTNLDVLFNGHIHMGHPPIKENNTFYINTGAMMRTTRNKTDMNRLPKYAMIEIKEGKLHCEYKTFQAYKADVFEELPDVDLETFFSDIELKDKEVKINAMDFLKTKLNENTSLSADARNALNELIMETH